MVRRVMVVEDDYVIRESLLEILEDAGFEVSGAVHGGDALAQLERATALPGVILLDLMMPVMDGRAFREEQLRRDAIASIPVIVVSAYRDVAENAHVMGVAGHLRKPVVLKELLALVERFCPPA